MLLFPPNATAFRIQHTLGNTAHVRGHAIRTRARTLAHGGSMAKLAASEFGNKNGYTPTEADTGEIYI